MCKKVKVGVYGIIKSGKSTILNAILAYVMTLYDLFSIPMLPAATLECTKLPTEIQVDVNNDRAGEIFSVQYSDGTLTDFPIEALRDGFPDEHAVGLVIYAPAAPLKLRLIDLPGLGSTVEIKHNSAVEHFMEDPGALDLLVHVVSGKESVETITSSGILPLPRIICVNKIDEMIRLDDSSTPESVMTSVVDGVRERIAGQSDVMPEAIVACSGLAGLSSVVWSDDVYERCLDIADGIVASGNLGLLSAQQYFSDAEIGGISEQMRLELSEAANAALRGAWNENSYSPALPALFFAIRLAVRERIDTATALRERLYSASGIDALRIAIESVAESPSVKQRRNLLPWVLQCQNDQHDINRLLGETRMLSEIARGMEMEMEMEVELSSGLAKLEISNFFRKLRAYMETQEETLAGRRQAIQRDLERVENDYRHQQVSQIPPIDSV